MKKGPLNRCYRLIWNAEWGSFVVASEFARRRGKGGGKRCKHLLAVAAGALLVPMVAWAAPTGGVVSTGSATVSQVGAVTTVTQSTQKASINWQGFSIGAKETVNFAQPSTSSVTLNRVIGNERSVIDGALNANGRVFLINSNGVLFSKGSSVSVGGLVASTLGLSDSDFQAGNYVFKGRGGSVINQGTITAADGGYVALLGGTVSNQGVITATKGTVALGGGSQVTLNFSGDSLASVVVDQGTLDALVENGEAIYADGGLVILSAKAADALSTSQVNNSGIIQARTLDDLKGSITLYAHGGTATVAGTLDASAPSLGDGGAIETSGDRVKIDDSAIITTKAAKGRTGSWLVDPTDFTIGLGSGDQTTSGIGVETLEKMLANNAVTIATSASGSGKGDINVDAALGAGDPWSGASVNGLPNSLTLTAANNINVNAPIYWNANTLTLNAGRNIYVNADMVAQGPTVGFVANYGTGTNADGTPMGLYVGQTSTSTFSGGIYFTGPATPVVTLNGAEYAVINSDADLTAVLNGNLSGNFVLGSDGSVSGVIGSATTPFEGNLNGFGHRVYASLVATGIFDTIGKGGTLSNLGVFNQISEPDSGSLGSGAVGALANYNQGKVLNTLGGDLQFAHTTLDSGATFYAGTLVGVNSGLIAQCSASGSLFTTNIAGGLVGYNAATGVLLDCDAVVSFANSTDYDNNPLASATYVGGLAGINAGTIQRSHATPALNLTDTTSMAGGLVGLNSGSISESHTSAYYSNTGPHLAGFAWENRGTISNAYSNALNTASADPLGRSNGNPLLTWDAGFVYRNSGTITNAYATETSGNTANSTRYGFVGDNTGGTIRNAYWYAKTSDEFATTPADTASGVTQLNGAQAAKFSSYAGFDSDIWGASTSGYAVLRDILLYVGSANIYEAPRYGEATSDLPSLGLSAAGLQGGDSVVVDIYDPVTNTFSSKFTVATDNGYVDAGTHSAASLLSSSIYKNIRGTILVVPKALTLSGVVADKTYDGTTAGEIAATSSHNGLVGLVGSQTLTATYSDPVFSDADAGTGKSVTLTANLFDGTNGGKSGNYTIRNTTTDPGTGATTTTTTGTILPKTLTATFTGSDKVYDGGKSDNVAFVSLDGVVGSDSVSLGSVSAIGTFADANVGSGKAVTVSGLSLAGSSSGNYTIGSAKTSAAITPLSLRLAGLKSSDDGVTTVGGSNIIAGNAVPGDVVIFSGSVTIDGSSVGTHVITNLSGLSIANPNYTLAGSVGTVTVSNQSLVLDRVASGAATVSTTGGTTTVKQTSDKAVLDWLRFNIASNETVAFAQPSASAIVLNRVIGNEQSVISGALNANGRVFIINSNGVLFASGSRVSAAGLVASALQTTDDNFNAGNYVFRAGGTKGSVINQGDIVLVDGGFLALVGKGVTNSGTLSAAGGEVLLASADHLILNTADKGLGSYLISGLDGATTVGGAITVANGGGSGGLLETAGETVSLSDGYMLETGSGGTWSWTLPAITIGGDGPLNSTFVKNNLSLRNLSLHALGGDLTVNDAVNWSADTTLTLSALKDININNAIALGGANAGLVMNYGGCNGTTVTTPAEGTDYIIRTPASYSGTVLDASGNPVAQQDTSGGIYGSITFSNSANLHGLKINGNTYTLIHSMEQLDAVDYSNAVTGYYYDKNTGKYSIANFSKSAYLTSSISYWTTIDGVRYYWDVKAQSYSIPETKVVNGDTRYYDPANGTWDLDNRAESVIQYYYFRVANQKYDIPGTLTPGGKAYYDPATGAYDLSSRYDDSLYSSYYYNSATRQYDQPCAKVVDYQPIYYNPTTGAYDLATEFDLISKSVYYNPSNGLFNLAAPFAVTGNYALASNLDASGKTYSNSLLMGFSGTFAGLGHTIDKLSLSSTSGQDLGLIRYAGSGSLIRDIGVTHGSIISANGGCDGFLLANALDVTVNNSYATGSISGTAGAGGLIGSALGVNHLNNDYFEGDITVTGAAGGLVAWLGGSILDAAGNPFMDYDTESVLNCHVAGTVTGHGGSIGGLFGVTSNTDIANSYFVGTSASKGLPITKDSDGDFHNTDVQSASDQEGGLVGQYEVSPLSSTAYSIVNSFAIANLAASSGQTVPVVGGLIGRIVDNADGNCNTSVKIENCYWQGDIHTVGSTVGGLIGVANAYTYAPITITRSHASGSIEVDGPISGSIALTSDAVGGLVGDMQEAGWGMANVISDSYSSVDITAAGIKAVGGLVGSTGLINISNDYATGNIVGGNWTGGLIGQTGGQRYFDSTTGLFHVTDSTISGSYFSGSLSGLHVGGLAGYMGYGSADNSYWNAGDNVSMAGGGLTQAGQVTGGTQGLDITAFSSGDIHSYLDGTINQVLAGREAATQAQQQKAFQAGGSEAAQAKLPASGQVEPGGSNAQGNPGALLDQNMSFADFSADVQRIEVDGQTFVLNGDDEKPQEKKPTAPAH